MLHGKMFNPNLRGFFHDCFINIQLLFTIKYGLIHLLYTLKWNGHQQIMPVCI